MISEMKIFLVMYLYLLQESKCEDYLKVQIEDIDIEFVNYTYFDENTFDISLSYQTEDKMMNLQINIIEDLPEDIFVKMNVWGHAFGKYNLPTGISMDMNICNSKLKDYFFNSLMTTLGFDNNCPPKKGSYEKKNFKAEIGGFPLHLLPGFRLLVETDTYSGSIVLLKSKAYLLVV